MQNKRHGAGHSKEDLLLPEGPKVLHPGKGHALLHRRKSLR